MSEEKKGITVKVPADLHAEVSEYLKANNKTMAEFVVMALQDELHPKNQNMEEKDNAHGIDAAVSTKPRAKRNPNPNHARL